MLTEARTDENSLGSHSVLDGAIRRSSIPGLRGKMRLDKLDRKTEVYLQRGLNDADSRCFTYILMKLQKKIPNSGTSALRNLTKLVLHLVRRIPIRIIHAKMVNS